MADPVLQISPNPGLIPEPAAPPVSSEPVGYSETPDELTTTGYTDQPAPKTPVVKAPPSAYSSSKEFVAQPEDVEQFKTWAPTGPKTYAGMVKPGNLDLTKRPIVHNADGSVSSLLSMSFGTDDGEVLVPKVSKDGRIMSDKEAMDHYRKTGETLGVFKTPDEADTYAEYLHNKQGAFQTWSNGGSYNPTVETSSSPVNVATPSGHVISYPAGTPHDQVQQHTQNWWDRMTDAAYVAVGHFVPESATGPLKAGMDYYVNPTNKALKKVGDVAVASVQGPNYGPKTRAYLRSQGVNPDGPMPDWLKGVNDESIRFAAQTVADPRMWPLFAEKLAIETPAVGRQILNRALAGTVATNASKDTVNQVRDLAKNWDTMSPKERSAALTGGTLSSVMAGLSGYHTVMGSPVSPGHVDHPADPVVAERPVEPSVLSAQAPAEPTVQPVVVAPEPSQVSEGPADRRSVPRSDVTEGGTRTFKLGNEHAAPLQPGERVALPSDEYTTGSRKLRLGTPRMEAPDLGQQARAASEAQFGPMKRGGQPTEPAKQPPLKPDGTPNWPANYVKTFLQDTDKGGSNYSDADLAALKSRLGLGSPEPSKSSTVVQTVPRPFGFDVAYHDPASGSRVGHLQIDNGSIPNSATIKAVDVDEGQQRQGIATKLYQQAKQELQQRGITKLTGSLEGSGPVQLREKVFGAGNTKYFHGGNEISAKQAIKVMDEDFGYVRAETNVSPSKKSFKKAAGGPTAKAAPANDLKGRLAERLTAALA